MAAGDDSSVNLGTPTGTTDTRLNAAGEHRQVVALGNAGDVVAGMEPWGALNVSQGASTIFVDPWAGATLDTTDRWSVMTGSTPTVGGGNMTMPAGTVSVRITSSPRSRVTHSDAVPDPVRASPQPAGAPAARRETRQAGLNAMR